MKSLLRGIANLFLGLLGGMLLIRLVRYFYKFPMPYFMADLIDNPLRRRIQPPDELAVRHGLRPGMTVLEVGPGNGSYTLAAARRVGPQGRVIAVDIQPEMVATMRRRVLREGVENIEGRIEDVHCLSFGDATFDAIYMITVIGEIPDPEGAMHEFFRVLKPGGTLAFSELLPDPDYPLPNTTLRRAVPAGFYLKEKWGNGFAYTLVFEKPA